MLKLADSYAPTHMFAEYGVAGFIEDVQSAGVDIEVEYYPSGQLGSARDIASLTRSGAIDVSPAAPAYLSDQLPLSSVTDLPGLADDSCVAAQSFLELLEPGGILFETEYAPRGLRPLWVGVIPGYEFMTVSRQIHAPSDVRGLTLRSSGGAMDSNIAAVGGAPVSMPAADAYEALARGTVDGVSFPPASIIPYKLQEVLKYSTDGLNAGAFAIPYVISEVTWDSLSDEQRSVISQSANEAMTRLCNGIGSEQPKAIETMKSDGVEFISFDEEQAAEFEALLEPVRTKWAERFDAAGKPGSEVLAAYEEAIQRNESEATP
ncbi:ABC transporter substrate-binding protein [Brevibacterium luteolum]|uniref:ABC transporter substrate-binding protein n=1 Tax=Brevibacterium luteolum TaxID=199591 RepID=A0A2N6PJU3_9MICO|nr:ABC transporter substrate-binding protein [Brevibacterium luteolum]